MESMESRLTVRIEHIKEEHAPVIQQLASHPAISDATTLPSPYPEEGAITWIRHTEELRKEGREYAFAVFAGNALVGVCSILNLEKTNCSAELGYWIGRPFWGHGYATKAARLVLRFAFEDLGLETVLSSCMVRNRASRRVLEKLGFTFTTTGEAPPLYRKSKINLEPFDYFELPRSRWFAGLE